MKDISNDDRLMLWLRRARSGLTRVALATLAGPREASGWYRLGPPDQPPGQHVGGLAVGVGFLAGDKGAPVSLDPLHHPSTTGRQVVADFGAVQPHPIHIDDVQVGPATMPGFGDRPASSEPTTSDPANSSRLTPQAEILAGPAQVVYRSSQLMSC